MLHVSSVLPTAEVLLLYWRLPIKMCSKMGFDLAQWPRELLCESKVYTNTIKGISVTVYFFHVGPWSNSITVPHWFIIIGGKSIYNDVLCRLNSVQPVMCWGKTFFRTIIISIVFYITAFLVDEFITCGSWIHFKICWVKSRQKMIIMRCCLSRPSEHFVFLCQSR